MISVDVAGSEVRLRWDAAGWELASRPDWSRLEGIRLISATFEDGAVLGVATVRPRDARGHGDDAVTARFVDPDGIETASPEALVSVEYDPERRPRRLGIELWPDADLAPLRIAADREPREEDRPVDDRELVAMSFRLDGVGGHGTYELLRQS